MVTRRSIRRERSRRSARVGGAIAASLSILAVQAFAPSAGASSKPGSDSPVGPDDLGVTATPDGWIEYGHLVTSSLVMSEKTSSTRRGVMDENGDCIYDVGQALAPAGASAVEEVVAANPKTCEERVVSGTVKVDSTGTPSKIRRMSTSSGWIGCDDSLTSSVYQPAPPEDHDYRVYWKTAWIDPVCVTITSLTANLRWKGVEPSEAVISDSSEFRPYNFAYDGWTNVQVATKHSLNGSNYAGFDGTQTKKNVDFELMLEGLALAALGPGGPVLVAAACDGTDAAKFTHYSKIEGFPDGSAQSYGSSVSASGGCSNLVHSASWIGHGFTS